MSKHEEHQYFELCRRILEEGIYRPDRTGTGTYSVFGHQMRFDLKESFPLLTTKNVPLRLVAEELFWFLKGDTNIRELVAKNVHIWDDWPFKKYWESEEATQISHEEFVQMLESDEFRERWEEIGYEAYLESEEYMKFEMDRFCERIVEDEDFALRHGDLGPVYGKQWRSWEGANGETFDQIVSVLKEIKENPESRRLIVSAWKTDEVDKMALAPCHCLFQFYVADGRLSCQLYQRSADVFLGVPFNIPSYALLTIMMAQITGLEPGEFIHSIGDAHIYSNHVEQVKTQMAREPYPFPRVELNKDIDDLFAFTWEDITLIDYKRHPALKGKVAV